MKRRLVMPVPYSLLFFLMWISSPHAYAQATVATNVKEALAQLGMDKSVEVVQVNKYFVLAKPKGLPNGTVDHTLWNNIQKDLSEAKVSGAKGHWLHDNRFMSKLFGNGIYSYRQRALPSLQAVFYFPGAPNTPRSLKFDETPYFIRLDVDRFPPGSTKFNSGRHFVVEVLPHWLLHRCTNQRKIAAQLNKNKLRNEKAHSQNGPGK